MKIKNNIPNTITLLNLLSGVLSIICSFEYNIAIAAILIFAGAIFDFFDGMAARILKVQSPIGKELDSLADVITFGVAPGIIALQLINQYPISNEYFLFNQPIFAIAALFLPVCAALRLAKFNTDTEQSESFKGLPSPSAGIFIASIPLMNGDIFDIYFKTYILNPYFLFFSTILISLLMVTNTPLLSLKFKNLTWQNNQPRYFLITISIVLLLTLSFIAIPFILFLYFLLSIIYNSKKQTHEIQS